MSSQPEARDVGPQEASTPPPCWCGSDALEDFSDTYRKCNACGTLVVARMPDGDHARVTDDALDFYGAGYHLTERYGQPSVVERARTDLPERCLHWLRTLLRHRSPPARVLDVGCGNGSFVALLRWAGFDASGLELSRTIVEYARRVFAVPILHGPLAAQTIAAGSLDIIALLDVVEHFPDPVAALRDCIPPLADDGLLFVQTPRFPEEQTYDEMVAARAPFLEMLKEREHIYLFSERAITELLGRLGLAHIQFEPAIFAHYDMSLMASRRPVAGDRDPHLGPDDALPAGARLVEALLSLDDRRRELTRVIGELSDRLSIAEEHAAQRLELIGKQGDLLGHAESERNIARLLVEDLTARLLAAEEERDANGRCAVEHATRVESLYAEKCALEARVDSLSGHAAEWAARADERLDALHQRDAQLATLRNALSSARDRLAELEKHQSFLARFWRRARRRHGGSTP